ncbi:CRISPR-associated endonuclease Csn1 [Balneicella halophila]|uniref:CRISPR-associated endonuclease Cas9 n=1 Tax=Balneicella halophila TaxID=1537566 RepID=A0A7L4UPL3_BALHA|nr:type II CRISPR RNA-guided endonuclease Cas9 [Balneicella halophila]PVX49993.1 CRISPR-associated endonuclease Csn1 [Balneicella halophila]
MKRILGLDLGTNSIGWALVHQSEAKEELSEIIKLGVRVNPLTVDEKRDFEAGRPLSTNAERTSKRGARRNLQRFKLRRKKLIEILIKNHFITEETPLTEIGKGTTHQNLELRAKSAREKVELEDLAKIFLAINKKRGYKSSRKVQNEEDDQPIDAMSIAKEIYEKEITVGQYVLNLLEEDKKYIPDFYRSDLQQEFDKVWNFQKRFYPEILTDELYKELQNKNKTRTWAICKEPFQLVGISLTEKGADLKKKKYQLRSQMIAEKLDLELLAIVLQEINNDLNKSSGYLGAISDRSKELYFNNETVGENLWKQIKDNPHTSLKNQVFYRQDYLDEFEQIWETQAKYHKELTPKLKEEIRDVIIFYQRKLKSQKSLLSFCQFESWKIDKKDEKGNIIQNKLSGLPKQQRIGRRVISKSSPLFQEFKIWQNINNLVFRRMYGATKDLFNQEIQTDYILKDEDRNLLFEQLNIRGKLKEKDVLKTLGLNAKLWKTNFPEGLEGNRTNEALYKVYKLIAENEGYGFNWDRKNATEIKEELSAIFTEIGINSNILDFDANIEGEEFEKQASYQLWHLLYSAEDDNNTKISEEDIEKYGNTSVNLKKKLCEKFGFIPKYAKLLVNIPLQPDYGNLSSKAIRKIMPYLQEGHIYSEACSLAGYNHSNSLTKEDNENRELADYLELLPKNSLRNPVVEKILNQMVNVVNQIIDEYGKLDAIHIELARELKKNAKERELATKRINEATKRNEEIKKKISEDFNIPNPTRNDVIRYRLWEELKTNGYKTVFTNQYIPYEKLFSKEIEIEHIMPKALIFDDSFSNKTLAYHSENQAKGNRTAIDFISNDNSLDVENYQTRVDLLYDNGKGTITKAKRNKLLLSQKDLPDGFIERDLRNSQYIAKQAKNMLQTVVREPVVSTSGNITNKLREDWDLINIMKELNLPKYRALGLTEFEERLNKQTGKCVKHEVIKDWTKRNDHRHHAMDALTVAFTTHNHIQYLNNLNARKDENHDKHLSILKIQNKITKYEDSKRKFIAPMPNFRSEAKRHIESILVSIKNKNKVVTINKNYTKGGTAKPQQTFTPRGQLHKETVYGKSKRLMTKPTKLNKNFTQEYCRLIANPYLKGIVAEHLAKYNNKPEIAFSAKILKKEPILYKDNAIKEVLCYEDIFTIRKTIAPDLKLDKVIDLRVQDVLQNRLNEYNGNSKKAFSDIEKNPIWLNKEKGIAIKRVTITGVSNVEALHTKKDHLGQNILDEQGNTQPINYVSTGNNHHVAIYRDSEGDLQEKVVSLFEAVERVNQRLAIIDKEYKKDLGWEFLFTMKQNEMFVFPTEDFKPHEIDLLDIENADRISPHLFRVQKIGSKDYWFRHHLETTITNNLNFTYCRVTSTKPLEGIVKVRINHIGEIVQAGEY